MSHRSHEECVETRAVLTIGDEANPQINRRLVLRLLEAGQFRDLYLLLTQARRSRPYDLELLRSLRVLEWYFDKKAPELARAV